MEDNRIAKFIIKRLENLICDCQSVIDDSEPNEAVQAQLDVFKDEIMRLKRLV